MSGDCHTCARCAFDEALQEAKCPFEGDDPEVDDWAEFEVEEWDSGLPLTTGHAPCPRYVGADQSREAVLLSLASWARGQRYSVTAVREALEGLSEWP